MSLLSVCQTEVVTMDRKSSLKSVAELMQKKHVGSVVVTDGFNGQRIPVGIITDRDIALAIGSSPRPQDIIVEVIMQSHPITVKTSDGIFETIVKMRENGIKRLPVVMDDGSLFGIITADDLLVLMGQEINNLAQIPETQVNHERGIRKPTAKQLSI